MGGSHDPPRLTIYSFPAICFRVLQRRTKLPARVGWQCRAHYLRNICTGQRRRCACMSRGFRSDPERLLLCELNARCSTARAIPESQLTNGLRCYYYWDTTAVLQNCEHYRRILLPQWRKIVLCFTDPTHSPHTVAGLRCCSQRPGPFLTRKSRIGMPSDKTLAALYPRILGHAMPTQGCGKGSRRKKPSSLAAHHGEFHVSTPYWHPQCNPGYRAQSAWRAQSRSQSGIPDGAAL